MSHSSLAIVARLRASGVARRCIAALAAFLALLGGAVHAQTAPDAGALQRQIEHDALPPLPGRGVGPASAPQPTLTLPDGATIEVRAFAFDGNALLDDAQLQAVVQPWLEHSIGFADLQAAARAVAQAYRDAGWIVSTYLPRQDVTEGRVVIRVVEARFAGARIDDPPPERMRAERVLSYFDANQPRDEPLNARALDRALLLADDLPGVAVAGALEPGSAEGQTGIALRVVDEPLIGGEGGVDNAGARSTGAERLTLALRAANPSGFGDQVGLQALKSRGTQYARLDYALPVGNDGLRVGASLSGFDYRLVGAGFKALDASGASVGAGVNANVPLLRSRLTNIYAQATLDHKRLRNKAQGATQSNYAIRSLGLGLTGNHFDDSWGGGSTRWAVTFVNGRVAHGSADPGEDPSLRGSYQLVRWSFARVQSLAALSPSLSASVAASGQFSSKNVDSSERLYLGGPAGVRAYPVNEAGGSQGAVLNLELRWRARPDLQASVFYDVGHVSSRGSASTSAPPDATLKGAGVALQWSTPMGVELSLTLAHRDGRNPHPTAAGRDQDGSLKKLRPWLQASFAF